MAEGWLARVAPPQRARARPCAGRRPVQPAVTARGHPLPSPRLQSQMPSKLLTLSNWKLMAIARESRR